MSEPMKYDIPLNASSGKCRGCMAHIRWIETKNGVRMPVNSDGTSHFGTCPQAARFSRAKKKTPRGEGQKDLFTQEG